MKFFRNHKEEFIGIIFQHIYFLNTLKYIHLNKYINTFFPFIFLLVLLIEKEYKVAKTELCQLFGVH